MVLGSLTNSSLGVLLLSILHTAFPWEPFCWSILWLKRQFRNGCIKALELHTKTSFVTSGKGLRILCLKKKNTMKGGCCLFMYLKGNHLGPENEQEPGFSLVESRRKAFPEIQALLPAIYFWDSGTPLFWRCASKALGCQGQYWGQSLKSITMDCDCQDYIQTVKFCDSE